MSDFDKEAEREKLREKFERDREKRQQSERMSELLLKGATMTNKHHDCGSPIFRWEGEEFCPSCEGPNGARGAEADVQESPADAETGPESSNRNVEVGGPSADTADEPDDATTRDATTDEAAGAPGGPADPTDRTEIDVATGSPTDDRVAVEPEADAASGPESTVTPSAGSTRSTAESRPTGHTEGTTGHEPAGDEGVAAARASLERTLAAVAREAEETPTTDLSRKRNLVAAARETAEALEATRRAGRQ
ncbi:MAG: Sjogren's syndrome/scleroderma autoantigen 1 family protein [Haloarculaceae archaeon]